MSGSKGRLDVTQLENLGIFELRELAREIGVHLPTTLRKGDLIAKIREIAKGEAEPFVPTSRKGRPPKSYSGGIRNVTDTASNDIVFDYRNWGKFDGEYSLTMRDVAYQMSDNDSLEFDESHYGITCGVTGIVFVDKQGFGRLHEGNLSEIGMRKIAKVSRACIEKFNLKNGDIISGKIGESLRDGAFCLFDVSTVNGEFVRAIRPDFTSFRAMPVTEQLKFSDNYLAFTDLLCPIGKGQRVFVQSKDSSSNAHFLYKLADNLSRLMPTIYMVLDEQPENVLITNNKNLEFVLCPFDLEKEKQLYILELAVESAKRYAEQGDDVSIVIEDINIVRVLYSRYYGTTGESDANIAENTIQTIRQLLATGRNLDNSGSITFVVGMANNQDVDTSFVSDLKRACSSIITINSSNDFTPLDFDISNTYTLYPERMLGSSTPCANELRSKCIGKTPSEVDKILKESQDILLNQAI